MKFIKVIRNIITWAKIEYANMQEAKKYRVEDDPVHSCIAYKKQGCGHVDGPLCDMATCNIRQSFERDYVICEECGHIQDNNKL